jgi:hypothetical protein
MEKEDSMAKEPIKHVTEHLALLAMIRDRKRQPSETHSEGHDLKAIAGTDPTDSGVASEPPSFKEDTGTATA